MIPEPEDRPGRRAEATPAVVVEHTLMDPVPERLPPPTARRTRCGCAAR